MRVNIFRKILPDLNSIILKRGVVIVFCFVQCFLFAQNKEIDSLKVILKSAEGKEEVEILNELAYLYRMNDPDQTKLFAIEALNKAESIGDNELIGNSFQSLGLAYYYSGDFDKALKYDQKSIEFFKKADLKKAIARATSNIAIDYSMLGQNDKAIETFLEAIELSEAISYRSNIAFVKRYMGFHYATIGEFQKSITYYQEAYEIQIELNEEESQVDILNEIGNVYLDLGDYQQTLDYYQKALDISEEMNYKEGEAMMYNNIANLYADWLDLENALEYYQKALFLSGEMSDNEGVAVAFNNIGEVFSKIGDNDSAYYYFQKSLEIKRILGDSLRISNTLLNIADLYFKQEKNSEALAILNTCLNTYRKAGVQRHESLVLHKMAEVFFGKKEFEKALLYLNRSLQIAEKIRALEEMRKVYLLYYKLYSEIHDYKNALIYHEKYVAIKDSIFNDKSQRKMIAFQTKYDTEKKENQIQLLIKDRKLQDSRQKNTNNIFIAIGAFLVVVTLFLYNRYRVKQASNKHLEIKNIEILRQKELIDEKSVLLDETINKLEETNSELEKLSIVARETDNAIIIADANGNIEWVNQGFTRMYGYTYEEFIKIKGATLIDSCSDFNIKSKIKYSSESKKPIVYDTLHLTKDGFVKWVQTALTPIVNEVNSLVRMVAIETDITKIKKAEDEARNARMAEESNRSKSEFLANMSHEIRTPLNAIIGFAKLLAHEELSEKGKGFVDTIEGNGKMLLTLINDILDLSKVESDRMEIKREPVVVRTLFQEAIAMFLHKAKEKGLDIELEVSDDVPTSVMLDEKRTRQVLLNLIGNAVKFTEKGYVKVELKSNRNELNSKLVNLEFHVKDSGIGIEKDKQIAIFEAFKQQSGASIRKYSGTGLGLTITKRFVEVMGGSINLESKEKTGTVFTIMIPDLLVVDADIAVVDNERGNEEYEKLNGETLKGIEFYLEVLQQELFGFNIESEEDLERFNEGFGPLNIEYETIKKSPKINQIKNFAKSLRNIGEIYDFKSLIKLGEDLFDEANKFNIKNMKKLLSYYIGLYELINSKIDNEQ